MYKVRLVGGPRDNELIEINRLKPYLEFPIYPKIPVTFRPGITYPIIPPIRIALYRKMPYRYDYEYIS